MSELSMTTLGVPRENGISLPLELRAIPLCLATPTAGASKVTGRAVIYGSESDDLGGFTEIIAAGAFRDSLADPKFDGRVLLNHDRKYVIGRKSAGTCQFFDSPTDLSFTADCPNTSWASDMKVSMTRGDINQCSFSFFIVQAHWQPGLSRRVRVVDKGLLVEVSIVSFPAYGTTSAQIEAARLAVEKAHLNRSRSLGGIQ